MELGSSSGASCELPAAAASDHHSEDSEEEPPESESESPDERTALHRAIEEGDEERVRELLASGFDARVPDRQGEKPLHTATYFNRTAIAEILMETDDRIDVEDDEGRTPLHYAARFGHMGMIRKLLAAGANPRFQDEWRQTPLHLALYFRNDAAVELLLDADSGIDIQDEDERTPLHHAATRGCVDAARRMLFSGVRPHVMDIDSQYPLQEALNEGHERVVKVILAWCAWRDIAMDWDEMKLPQEQTRRCIRLLSECHKEIQRMEDTRVLQSRVSFCEVARRHACWVTPYLTSETIRRVLQSGCVRLDFPIYCDLITMKLRRAKQRRALTDRSLDCFSLLWAPLPSPVTDILMFCLSDSDLRNLIRAIEFEP
ncbi:26S proteasome non-ATPase regulatory subunit 10-like [Uloborus diversus]|uniref:26S proteasome non-ATPase regulatory subunit 10-like n=1 Tax=Uloborus diversus TaxID=327109 RepID=UPI00240A5292|nr:26S proteasome non-ATPase regulatory subunit 10-like [Uloborus diversus]